MICAGIKAGIVVAIIQVADEANYQLFSGYFDNFIDTTPFAHLPAIGWSWTGIDFNYGQLLSSPSIKITKLAFESRLTPQEEAGIIGFALANFNNSDSTIRSAACVVFALLRRQSNAGYVDLARPDTIAGVGALVSFGLLTSDRAHQILTTPPTTSESYEG